MEDCPKALKSCSCSHIQTCCVDSTCQNYAELSWRVSVQFLPEYAGMFLCRSKMHQIWTAKNTQFFSQWWLISNCSSHKTSEHLEKIVYKSYMDYFYLLCDCQCLSPKKDKSPSSHTFSFVLLRKWSGKKLRKDLWHE